MRPPEFTGGNNRTAAGVDASIGASMRPPEFTGGNHHHVDASIGASMTIGETADRLASMRPPEFTGGNLATGRATKKAGESLQ